MLLECGVCPLYLRMHERTGWITSHIWWFMYIKRLTTIFKVAGYFSTECVRSLEEHTHTHTHKTWNKLERSRVLSHSFTTDVNAPLLLEMLVCFTEWYCSSWPSRFVRDYLIIFQILDSVSLLTIICLEYGLGYAILSAFYFVQAILSIQFSIHLERGTW